MGVHERKQREYEKRKKLILDTARKMFRRKSFNGVTLDEIAHEIEFSKGTIYSHFESKEEIFAQILLEHLNRLIDYLKQASETSSGTEDGIRHALAAYLRFYDQYPDYCRLLFFMDVLGDQYRIPETLLKEIQRKKIACLSELQQILKKSAKNAKNLALLLWGMINGILQLVDSRQIKRGDLDRLIDLGFEVVMSGLANRFASPQRGESHGSI
jgi:AcrR family transcriptional regulator